MRLLDGSLGGSGVDGGAAGPKFGVYDSKLKSFVTSNVKDVRIDIATSAAWGGESAIWDADGKVLTLSLAENQTYTQSEIDNFHMDVFFTEEPEKEHMETVTPMTYKTDGSINKGAAFGSSNAYYTLHLASGTEYSAADIENIFMREGLDVTVELSGATPDEPNTLFVASDSDPLGGPGGYSLCGTLTGGAGLGDSNAFLGDAEYAVQAGGKGIILQVGANEGQAMSFSIDNMSAAALGVNDSNVDLSTQTGASQSLGKIDKAIAKISKQRSLLGAVQNRLEHTISNLDNTAENLQSAESGIRDADMALEMVSMSKYNILQQAGQSMLAQANQSSQGVLSLLQG